MGLRVPRPSSVGTQILSWMRRLVSSFFQSQWVKIGHCASTVTKVADFCLLFIHTYLTYHHAPHTLSSQHTLLTKYILCMPQARLQRYNYKLLFLSINMRQAQELIGHE